MRIDPKDIKPAVKGKSDFFSWQLYRWCRAKVGLTSIFAGTWNSCDGINPDRPVLYIGLMDDDGWFHGKLLRGLCTYGADLQSWAYGPAHDTANWKDVTESFWRDYMQRGVCAIHGDLSHSWTHDSEAHRRCLWCGKEEALKAIYRKVHIWEQAA